MRYLGGGIGHLEQFPPANNDSEVTYEYKDDEDEIGTNDDETGDTNKNRGRENEEGDPDEDGNTVDDSDEDDGAAESNECSDPGESSDEDMGNTY